MDFEALKEIVKLISRHKVKDIELLGSEIGEESTRKLNQLYDGITRGQFSTDDEAAAFLYGSNANASHAEYRRLRNRLIKQLLNTSFFMDTHLPIYTDRARMSYQIYKDFAAANLLLSRDARKAGIFLMEQVVEVGMKYEFIAVVADAARMIRTIASGGLGDTALHAKYAKIHRQYEEMRHLEFQAFEEYQHVVQHFINGSSTNKEVFEYTSVVFPKLINNAPLVDTANYYFYAYSVGIAHYSSINDAQNGLDLCNQAIIVLGQKEHFVQGKMLGLLVNKLYFLTQLRQFNMEDALKTMALCESLLNKGETNWFKTQQVWLHFNLHAGHYENALQIYLDIVSHPRYAIMTGLTAEIWRIYEGYFQLLKELGVLKTSASITEFKATRFINDFPVLSKERTGMYIPILMLPVIFSVVSKDPKQEIKSEDALDKYRQRYLQNDQNVRSAIFVKLLLALAKRPYEPAKAHKKIQVELANLAENPIEKAGQSYTVEIIPYEVLWEMLDAACK